MFVFQKIWRALFSCNTQFEIRPFALLPTKINLTPEERIVVFKSPVISKIIFQALIAAVPSHILEL